MLPKKSCLTFLCILKYRKVFKMLLIHLKNKLKSSEINVMKQIHIVGIYFSYLFDLIFIYLFIYFYLYSAL